MAKDFGGRMTFRLSTGVLLSLRATVNLSPGRNSIESVANQDGSLDRTATVKAGRCEITFADSGIDVDALLTGDRFNATLAEDFSKTSHYFTNAFVTGDPVINRMNGEVTGVAVEFELYQRGTN
jgi:hypothetical protein